MQVLIIAEDPEERDILSHIFRHAGLRVITQRDQLQLLNHSFDRSFDLILITREETLELSTINGIRQVTQAPIILITNPVSESAHCALLDNGIDMVFQRPIPLRLLTRYSKLVLRRASGFPASILDPIESERIQLNPSNRTVSVYGGEERRLTQLEFRLLYVLMTNQDQVMTTDELIERVWGYTGDGNRDLVRGLIRRLRKKIEPEGKPHFIHNLPGVGYRFTTRN
ncbi:MAG: response regulator transcription factor [Chloroflexota bacterium]